MENYNLFVYGTLKKGYGNHRIIQKSEYSWDFISVQKFDLSDYGFPCLYPNDHGKKAKGEIYKLTKEDFIFTDRLESNGSLYRREIQKFYNCNKAVDAWIYIIITPGMPIEVEDEIIDWNYNTSRISTYIWQRIPYVPLLNIMFVVSERVESI